MDVSIIVVNHNTSELTRATLRSIFTHTRGLEFEVIVVDNASSDGSVGTIAAEFPRVTLLAQSDNIGFGRANNAGIERARGRNIFLLNPDTLLRDNAVKALSDHLDDHPDCGVCGGNLVDSRGRAEHSFKRVLPGLSSQWNDLFGGLPFLLRWGLNAEFNRTGRAMEVGYITGADMMVRASVLAEVGGFDPDFFLYYEETELTARIRRAGYRVMSIPWVVITHLRGKSSGCPRARMAHVVRSYDLYLRKVWPPHVVRQLNRLALLEARIKAVLMFWNPRARVKLAERIKLLKP